MAEFDWGSAGSSLFDSIANYAGAKASAKADQASAASLRKLAAMSQVATKMKLRQADREIYKVTGGARADIAANGLLITGSAADAIRSTQQQGGLQKALLGQQGKMEYESYIGQAQAAEAAAKAKKKGAKGGIIGSLAGSAAKAAFAFSDDRLKTDIKLLHRREDGIGVYLFKYLGDGARYIGVLASEVEKLYPDAIWENEDGQRMVDYGMLDARLTKVA